MNDITAEQLEQAIGILANVVAWSRPPASDTISPLQQMQQAQSALSIVVGVARDRVKPETNGQGTVELVADE